MEKLNIGICGYGIIGSGVKKLVDAKEDIEVLKVFDRPFKKEELGNLYAGDYKEITRDPSIDIVVETMGGNEFPYEVIIDALKNKKHVVTSNKEVVSLHLKEFVELAKDNGVNFLFEASVGGGIPIINSLIQNRKVNEINHIYGILNGTTNYILSKLNGGFTYEEALKDAQEKGFAELDPSADLEGLDMVRKISILSDIAYKTFIDITKVVNIGLTGITKEIIDTIKKEGKVLKFICESVKNGDEISLIVEPIILKKEELVSNINNEFNIVIIEGETNGELCFIGKGAGSLPTASAVLSDIYLIKDNKGYGYLDLSNNYKYVYARNKEYLSYSFDGKNLGIASRLDKNTFNARVFK